MPRDAASHLLAKLRIHPNLNFTDPSNYETSMDNNQLALGPLRQHQEALEQQINRPIACRSRIVVKSPMGRALLTIASVLTRPPVIIMTINAINIAKYSVEQFDSSTGEKVMSIISYSTPGVFAACMAWLLWYRVSHSRNRLSF